MADSGHAHPSPRQYVVIAVALAIVTAVEVGLFYVGESVELGTFEPLALVFLSFVKFIVVIGWYMHLRFEKSTLSRFFTAGFVLALMLYAVVLGALGVLVIRG